MRKAGSGLSAVNAEVPVRRGQDGWARSRTSERGRTVSWPSAPTEASSAMLGVALASAVSLALAVWEFAVAALGAGMFIAAEDHRHPA